MIEAKPRKIACPDCGHVHEDPQYVSYLITGSTLFSDLYELVYSMADLRPKFATCTACHRVNFLDAYREISPADSAHAPRWKRASWEEGCVALQKQQPPFQSGTGYAFALLKHLWQVENYRVAGGVPVADPERRVEWQETLLQTFSSLASEPVNHYLKCETQRQMGDRFEVAAHGLRSLIEDCDDKLLVFFSRQILASCLEGRFHQQKLCMPPKAQIESAASPRSSRGFKIVMAVSDVGVQETVGRWVTFPNGVMTIGLKFLPEAAKIASPLGGIVLLESDLAALWSGEAGMSAFIESIAKIHGSAPWLILGSPTNTLARVAALRRAGFHVTSMDSSQLSRERFLDWCRHGQLRAEHQWRRLQKHARIP